MLVLDNAGQKFDGRLTTLLQAGRCSVQNRMDADSDSNREAVCCVDNQSTLIWEVGRHLPLEGVVKIRSGVCKHLTHSHCLGYYF